MEAQNLNSSTRRVAVTGTSKNFALALPTTGGESAILQSFGSGVAFVTAGQGSAVTAVFPVADGAAVTGKRVPVGAIVSYSLPVGTTHLSYISNGTDVDLDISVDTGN
jgi:hypothetical protein